MIYSNEPGDNLPAFLFWIREREAIRLRREAGASFPWTDDLILRTYRFCNVRREDDRMTIWIRQNVREPYADHSNLWFMLCMSRFINWAPTLQYLINKDIWPREEYDPEATVAALDDLTSIGVKVWTGAYLIKGESANVSSEQRRKPFYVANTVLGATWKQSASIISCFRKGLQATCEKLQTIHGWGPFLSYQAVVDMRFTRILAEAPDLDWAAAGPGTIRGLNRLYDRTLTYSLSQRQALQEMREIYPIFKGEVSIDFSDVPNILCEVDKYLRVKLGEGKPKTRYRSEEWPVYVGS